MLLKNATTLTLFPPRIRRTDLRIEMAKVSGTGANLRRRPGEEVADLDGKFLMPGFVNAHTHLYSSLSRGMPAPGRAPANFPEILRRVWWKLDRALDDELIFYSAVAGAMDAALCGTTTLVDHHASPNAIAGSLDLIREALELVGLRGILCYEVTDRGGRKKRDAGLIENEWFIRAHRGHPRFRGVVGAHAAFTLGDESLGLCGSMAERLDTGVHIHLAEDRCDVTDARKRFGRSVVERLADNGVLRRKSILAHCIHIDDFSALRRSQAWMVHNPRSNMNNGVGHAPVHRFGDRAALGTDGFPADMLEEARTGTFRNSENRSRGGSFGTVAGCLGGAQAMASEIFGTPLGLPNKGAAADFVVMNYRPPTPVTEENLLGHLLFGMNSSMVESVMVAGKWTVKDRRITGLDEEAILRKTSKAAAKLWKRMESL